MYNELIEWARERERKWSKLHYVFKFPFSINRLDFHLFTILCIYLFLCLRVYTRALCCVDFFLPMNNKIRTKYPFEYGHTWVRWGGNDNPLFGKMLLVGKAVESIWIVSRSIVYNWVCVYVSIFNALYSKHIRFELALFGNEL